MLLSLENNTSKGSLMLILIMIPIIVIVFIIYLLRFRQYKKKCDVILQEKQEVKTKKEKQVKLEEKAGLAKSVKIVRGLAIALAVAYFFRLFQLDYFEGILTNSRELIPNAFLRNAFIFLRWFTQGTLIVTLLAPFFNNRYYNTIVAFITPVIVLLNLICFKINVLAFIGPSAYAASSIFHPRSIIFLMELLITGAIGVIYLIKYIKKNLEVAPLKKSWLVAIFYALICISVTPGFTFYGLFGIPGQEAEGFTVAHRVLIYVSFLTPFIMYFLLRNKDYETRYLVLLTIALAGLLCYFYKYEFESFKHVGSWPFHLCNTAIILMAIAFVTRSKTFFYFNYFINVLGALCAILMPNTSTGVFTSGALHFWFNHMYAFFLPLLGVGLHIFPRPKFKMIMTAIAVFTVYFVVVGVVNAWFVNYDPGVNYFFMNDTFLADKFKFARPWRSNYIWTFNINGLTFKIYYVYWIAIYIAFIALTFAMWFVYDFLFKVSDQHYDLMVRKKRKKMELDQLLNNKQLEQAEINVEGRPMMVKISNFSKKYDSNSAYSVKDFNLEIHDGEIFGFVGHNGAGKSTLIKCLVGIQGITEGDISISGFDVRKEPMKAKFLVGYVPDNHAVYERLTGREYVNYIANLFLVSKKDREERIARYAKMFNLEDALDRQIKSYSHGMKQKITVIAALIHNPKLWVLDEPLTGLDPTSAYQIKECMKAHAAAGNIVFFSSHVIEVIENICDRIALISHGHLVGVYTIAELKEQNISLEQLYLDSINLDTTQFEGDKNV